MLSDIGTRVMASSTSTGAAGAKGAPYRRRISAGATNAAPTLTGSMMVSTSSIGMRAAALSVAGDSVKAAANLGSQVVAMIMGTKRSVVKSRVDTPYQPTTAWGAIRINIVESTHR